MAILVVSICYVFTATDRILSHGGEYQTTTVLFVGAALTTAAIVPWGVLAQLTTVMVGAVSLIVAVILHDGSLGSVSRDPAVDVGRGPFKHPWPSARRAQSGPRHSPL